MRFLRCNSNDSLYRGNADREAKKERRAAVERGEAPPDPIISAEKASALILAGLVVGSVVCHTTIMPRIGT